jgi:hypothetical protein
MKYTLVILITILSCLPALCQVVVVTPQQTPDMRYHQYPGYTYYGGDQRNPSQYIYNGQASTAWDARIFDSRSPVQTLPGGVFIIRPSDDDDD